MEDKNELLNNNDEPVTEQATDSEAALDTSVLQNESVIVETQDNETTKKPHKRILLGKVISNKPDKTIVVSVVSQVMHPLYKKYYKVTKKVMAHDEENSCNEGDTVKIKEHRPLSAKKRWILEEIVQRAK